MSNPRTYTGDDFRDALRGAAVIANHSASIIRELTEALKIARLYVDCHSELTATRDDLALIDAALKRAGAK